MLSARSSSPAVNEDHAGPAGPVRTCVGCRTRERSVDLLRVVAVDGVLEPDPRQRLPGRGAWMHPTSVCLDLAERRRAFGRALRFSGQLDSTAVREFLSALSSVSSVPTSPEIRKQVDPK